MPQAAVDPVVLAAMIVVRLQTVVSREVAPSDTVVLTIGSIRAGSTSNVIGDQAVLELNLRTYDESVRTAVLTAIRRIVIAECQASNSPKEPDFELYRTAARAGPVAQDIPVNRSPAFAPVIQPTIDTGTQALVVAALAWLAS